MANYLSVVIGIQARSTSSRFPNKVLEEINGKPMLAHVIEAARRSADYINRYSHKHNMMVKVALLIPTGDPIGNMFSKKVAVIRGDENDVIGRYISAIDVLGADYIVRITGDCPLLPHHVITAHINKARHNEYDYFSNTGTGLGSTRISADGHDCEIISSRLMKWLFENAEGEEREHVTSLIWKKRPDWAKGGGLVGHWSNDNLKLSVDTQDDLERVRAHDERIKQQMKDIEKIWGPNSVHRF